jgi:hypothetical protein
MYRLLFLLALANLARATEWHLTPAGSGKKDGTSWEHALDQSSLSRSVNELMKAGDRLLLGGGNYQDVALVISSGGSEGKAKTISGVDRGGGLPVFSSTWSIERPDKGPTAVRIEPGVSHVVIEKMRIKGYCFCIRAPQEKDAAPRSHLTFDDVDMEQFRHGFYLADCDDLRFTGCDLKRYSKHAFRFDQGCDRVALRQCTADCSEGDVEWENKTEVFPFGFNINDAGAPNTAFVFEDCVARNNLKHNQTPRYKNGDGFVVEGNTTGVIFLRCRSLRNQDGGFDLKVRDVRLTDCIAIGNKRDFRIWTTGTLTNCLGSGGESVLWCNGGPITATRCTFHAARGAAVMTDDKATEPITLNDCIIAVPPDAPKSRATAGKVILNATVVTVPGNPEKDPAFLRPDPLWDGLGDAMNSRTYPNKGYHGTATK